MKIKTFFLISVLLVFLLSGCQGNISTGRTDATFSVVTTIFAPFDFARALGSEDWNIKMLIPPGSESHSFEPTPQDIIAINNSDIFIYAGGESDTWVTELLKSMDNPELIRINMVDVVGELALEEPHDDAHHDDYPYDEDLHDDDHHDDDFHGDDHHVHEHDDEDHLNHSHHGFDEHVWTSPVNVKLISKAITAAMVQVDPANDWMYQNNLDGFLDELNQLDSAFRQVIANSPGNTLVFADRFPFRYFVHEYGLNYKAAFDGCTVDTNPSAATVAMLIREVRDKGIPVVLTVELSNQQIAQVIREETGAEIMEFHSAHNISAYDFHNGITYLEIMNNNVKVLEAALGER